MYIPLQMTAVLRIHLLGLSRRFNLQRNRKPSGSVAAEGLVGRGRGVRGDGVEVAAAEVMVVAEVGSGASGA